MTNDSDSARSGRTHGPQPSPPASDDRRRRPDAGADVERRGKPWRLLSRRQAFANPWIRVEDDRVLTPAGNPGDYAVVRFRNIAAAVIPLDGDGNTWLVGQYRYPLDRYTWEIPAGGAPAGEPPAVGAARELREETGLRAGSLCELMRLHPSNAVTDELAVIYVARDLREGRPAFDATERLQVRKLPFDAALAQVLDGRISDGLTVAGLLKLHALRNRFGL